MKVMIQCNFNSFEKTIIVSFYLPKEIYISFESASFKESLAKSSCGLQVLHIVKFFLL